MIQQADKELYEKLAILFGSFQELIQGAGGNLSIKTESQMIIKASGTFLSESDRYIICSLPDVQVLEGSGTPSMEVGFHLLPKRLIVHFHSLSFLSKIPQETDRILRLPYVQPGDALRDALQRSWKGEPIVSLENHGMIILADTEKELYDNLACLYEPSFLSTFHILREYYEVTSFVFLEIPNPSRFLFFKPFTPDLFLFLKRKPLHLSSTRSVKEQLDEYEQEEHLSPSILSIGNRVFSTGFSWKTCILVRDMYDAYCKLIQMPIQTTLTEEECIALLQCKKEAYRLRL